MRAWMVGLTLLVAAGCGDSGGPETTALTTTLWEPIEISVPVAVDDNPFDDQDTTVDAEIISPTGETTVVDGFAYRAYSRELIGGYEHRLPSSAVEWRIRFTPTAEGRWQFRWRAHGPSAQVGEWSSVDVGAAAAGEHGFVRRSTDDRRYLKLDDGSSFFPLGENMCWYDGRGTFAYDEWLARLVARGGNYIRLWMPSWAFGLEWTSRDGTGTLTGSTLGNYEARLDRAWQLDYVLELARRHHVYVMLAIQNHGPFSLSSNSEWADNPYNAANGGPLAAPRELFTDPEAKELFKRRLRYLVARWGYASNLMAWELWNEVDLADQPALADLTAWHTEMATVIRSHDPYRHLITTSTSQGDALDPSSPFGALWALEAIDFSQIHFYSFGGVAADFTQVFPRAYNRLRRYDKPVLVGEAGVDFRGPAETIAADPHGEGFHDLLWAAPFAQTFGSGMSWWWDNVVDPLDLYPHFTPLAQLVAGVDFPREGFIATSTIAMSADGHTLRLFTLRGRTTILGWLKNSLDLWHSPDPAVITGAVVSLDDLLAADWHGSWLDTRDGTTRALALAADGTAATFVAPDFRHDIAFRLERSSVVAPAAGG